jgi:stalled ribosome alternative rescue factor ArfA
MMMSASQLELKEKIHTMTESFNKYQDSTTTSYERLDRCVTELVTHMDMIEAHPPPQGPAPVIGVVVLSTAEGVVDDTDVDALLRRCLARNQQGMRGKGSYRHHNPELDNDLYAKIKFSILLFIRLYDAKAYLV